MLQSVVTSRWHFAEDPRELMPRLPADGYHAEAGRERQRTIDLYDDFDRSLTTAGLALIREGGAFHLTRAADLVSNTLRGDPIASDQRLFWWNFPPGAFREELRRHLGLRAATHLVRVLLEQQEFPVRNRNGKIVLRFWAETASVENRAAAHSLTLVPLLGYDEEASEFARSLSVLGELRAESEPLAYQVLRAVGRLERPLLLGSAVRIRPQATVREVVTEIARFLIRVARQNEDGIVQDIDTEFLHQYRVAIRKLRSMLELVQEAYPREDTLRWKKELGRHARATNRLRDLDVYLLDEGEHRYRLPPTLRLGLDRMFTDLRSERSRVLRDVQTRLVSGDYLEAIAAAEAWFDRDDLPGGNRSGEAMGRVAVEEIRRHHKLVRRSGRNLTDDTPDKEVHELRLECKKLRYLLELFGSLFPPKQLHKILRPLKRLQDVLGQFNDFTVQQEFLLHYLTTAKGLDSLSAAAVGGLIAVLHRHQRHARGEVVARFRAFGNDQTQKRLDRLLSRVEVLS